MVKFLAGFLAPGANLKTGSQLNTSFITRQLRDQLPPAARSILAWASLLGNSFSFNVIQSLMSGKFDFVDEEQNRDIQACQAAAELFARNATESAVEGLQACLQTSILVPCEDEDYFRFVFHVYHTLPKYLFATALVMSDINTLHRHFESFRT